MLPLESELVAARIARMKAMIADLETACDANAPNQKKFVWLKAELADLSHSTSKESGLRVVRIVHELVALGAS